MYDEKFMRAAFEEASGGVSLEEGGPFGAVIVIDNKIVGRGHNTVIKSKDPTAHAEINAIRDAAEKLDRIHLSDAAIYTTCEPCPMCLSAIYWSKIPTIYYSMDRHDADSLGFSDEFIYSELARPVDKRAVEMKQFGHRDIEKLMVDWKGKAGRLSY